MFIRLEWIPPLTRLRYRAMDRFDNGLDRPKLGESSDERAARTKLAPDSGQVTPAQRNAPALLRTAGRSTEAD